MEVVLVDTDVFSFLLKRDSRAQLYAKHVSGKLRAISFMSVAELYRWAIRRKWGQKRVARLRDRLRDYRVLPFDDQLAWEWARMMSLKGRPLPPGDAWIAATAVRHNIPLVTHNRRHFEGIAGLQVVSEG